MSTVDTSASMDPMPMSSHNVRVSDDLWERAGKRAADEGTNLSERIRTWLSAYADDKPRVRLTVAEQEAIREALGGLDIAGIVVDTVNKER